MSVRTEDKTVELVVREQPIRVYRTVKFVGESRWVTTSPGYLEHDTAMEALTYLREEVASMGRQPMLLEITWQDVPSGKQIPTTGTSLP